MRTHPHNQHCPAVPSVCVWVRVCVNPDRDLKLFRSYFAPDNRARMLHKSDILLMLGGRDAACRAMGRNADGDDDAEAAAQFSVSESSD